MVKTFLYLLLEIAEEATQVTQPSRATQQLRIVW